MWEIISQIPLYLILLMLAIFFLFTASFVLFLITGYLQFTHFLLIKRLKKNLPLYTFAGWFFKGILSIKAMFFAFVSDKRCDETLKEIFSTPEIERMKNPEINKKFMQLKRFYKIYYKFLGVFMLFMICIALVGIIFFKTI